MAARANRLRLVSPSVGCGRPGPSPGYPSVLSNSTIFIGGRAMHFCSVRAPRFSNFAVPLAFVVFLFNFTSFPTAAFLLWHCACVCFREKQVIVIRCTLHLHVISHRRTTLSSVHWCVMCGSHSTKSPDLVNTARPWSAWYIACSVKHSPHPPMSYTASAEHLCLSFPSLCATAPLGLRTIWASVSSTCGI
jgi:hypothetical protein